MVAKFDDPLKQPTDFATFNKIPPGTLHIVDPRSIARATQDITNQPVFTREGDGYIFPGWLEHFVTPHDEDGDRICITTNMHIFN